MESAEIRRERQDMNGSAGKAGFRKVRETCATVDAHGFKFVWIDTCCIDKTSSAELRRRSTPCTAGIDEAGLCFAYLGDVPPNPDGRQPKTVAPEFSVSFIQKFSW